MKTLQSGDMMNEAEKLIRIISLGNMINEAETIEDYDFAIKELERIKNLKVG